MSKPVEIINTREAIASEGDVPKVVNIKVLTVVPARLRSPRTEPTLVGRPPKRTNISKGSMF